MVIFIFYFLFVEGVIFIRGEIGIEQIFWDQKHSIDPANP